MYTKLQRERKEDMEFPEDFLETEKLQKVKLGENSKKRNTGKWICKLEN